LGEKCPEHTIQQRASAGIREVVEEKGESSSKQHLMGSSKQQLKSSSSSSQLSQLKKQTAASSHAPTEIVPQYKIGKTAPIPVIFCIMKSLKINCYKLGNVTF
jgi:hypothetical protein